MSNPKALQNLDRFLAFVETRNNEADWEDYPWAEEDMNEDWEDEWTTDYDYDDWEYDYSDDYDYDYGYDEWDYYGYGETYYYMDGPEEQGGIMEQITGWFSGDASNNMLTAIASIATIAAMQI